MTNFIIPLEKVQLSDTVRVGAKAAVLGSLLQAGFPVLSGLCITTAAFTLALEPTSDQIRAIIQQHNLHQPAEAERAAHLIGILLADLTVPPIVMNDLHQAWPATFDGRSPVAVRSSATAEDRADASFAGQYASVLGVSPLTRDEAALTNAIVTGWRSFFSANALVARATHSALKEEEAMAILIQPLILAESAGVCYSLDPVHHRHDLVVIDAAWGLGVGVVDGTVATDTTWIRRYGFKIADRRVASKARQIVFKPQEGLQATSVPLDQQTAACLPEKWSQRISQFCLAAEYYLGSPQDIEWAIVSEQIWLLQSRPLTALPDKLQTSRASASWIDEPEASHFWTLMLFADERGSTDVLLPLERDYLTVIEGMREESCLFLGEDRNQAVKFHRGRAFARPFPLKMTDGDRRIRQAANKDLKNRLQDQGLTAWDYWGPEIVSATERLRAFDPATASGLALAEHLEDALAVRRRHYMLHPFCWWRPPQSFIDMLATISGLTEPALEAMGYWLLEGEETPLSRLVDGLYSLADQARQIPAIAALITVDPSDVMAQLAAHTQAGPFLAQLTAFLTIYGERTGDGYGSEATICTPTWREKPQQLLRLISAYLESDIEPPAVARRRAQLKRDVQIERFSTACDDQALMSKFRHQLAYARRAWTVLEKHNHYIDQMALGQLRHAVLAAADWLVDQGALVSQEEIFWLYFEEILGALGTDKPASFTQTIATRQAQHVEWQALDPPSILGIPKAQLPNRPAFQAELTLTAPPNKSSLTGLGASPGRCSGRARVIFNSVSLPDIDQGDILVTENVGPRWTPLFPLLGGLILDGGSLGQHAAATAREYGVPAVIQTNQATRIIPAGAWVTVDGTAGTIELVAE